MTRIGAELRRRAAILERRAIAFGAREGAVTSLPLDRRGHIPLARPGLRSSNGSCRLLRAADGWLAVNLAREEDRDMLPAWLGCAPFEGRFPHHLAARRSVDDLVETGAELGLPVARAGETPVTGAPPPSLPMGRPAPRGSGPFRVFDLSALWAGPLCGAVLAAAGAQVDKVESVRRPDSTRVSTPDFFNRLNGAKRDVRLDLSAPAGQRRLREMIASSDVLITSLRPRGLASLGLNVEAVFAANPSLVWIAITGHGWTGPGAGRVAFGDDAAVAGGLVRWTSRGAPQFIGDALADPLTGLTAAACAFDAVEAGGGVLLDVSLASSAAEAAAACGLRAAA